MNAAVSHDKNPFTQSNFILVLNLDVNDISFHSISHRQFNSIATNDISIRVSTDTGASFGASLTTCASIHNAKNNRKLTLIHYMTDLPAIN